jgi:hypothetical protein
MNKKRFTLKGKLNVMKTSDRLQTISIDTLSGLPEGSQGQTCMIVINDLVSKFLMIIPVLNHNMENVAKAIIQNWITIFGCPRYILTDRGGGKNAVEYNNNLCLALYIAMNITKLSAVGYRPQAIGQPERSNTSII